MDDPIQTYDFIKNIIDNYSNSIVGLAISKGNRLTLTKGKSKFAYLISLFLIMGCTSFLRNSFLTILFRIKKYLSKFGICENPSIITYAKSKLITTKRIKSPNNRDFLNYLDSLNIDIIINQSQSIIKKQLLKIPSIGIINRHNALLPKNRGRLTPFWVLFNKEKETGVSIHFVDEGIDSGDIIIQKKFDVENKDNFNSIVKKNYGLASIAIIEALKILENDKFKIIPNDDKLATYNTTPSLIEAIKYRLRIIKGIIINKN
tara:strand:- start:580 stop:1362 length:783 start_codon:yes stop_codon:yes gene_type:complete